jgi:hypothetical protein
MPTEQSKTKDNALLTGIATIDGVTYLGTNARWVSLSDYRVGQFS